MLPVVFVAGIAVGIAAGFLLYRLHTKKQLKGAQEQSDKLIKEAFQEAERRKREMLTEAKEEILHLRQDAEKEVKERRSELQRAERRLEQKEENLDKRLENLQKREDEFRQKQEDFRSRMEEVEKLKQEQVQRLEEIAGMTRDEAREHLLREVEDEASHVIGLRIKELEEKAKREAEKRSREIVVGAIQRCAVDHTSEMSVSVVNLPSDEMKGRIIGREGRNIRAFETFTGVDLIVDEMIPAVAEQGIATFCDVFCEEGVFTIDQSRRILEAARQKGFKLRIHADEVNDLGGAGLAAELRTHSAEHLLAAGEENLKAMAREGVIANILPATAYSLKKPYAPVRKMIELGVPVALATDCNPGSCFTESMPFVFGLGVMNMDMSVEEALVATTLNAAWSVEMQDKVGSLETGKQADFLILDGETPAILAYHAGVSPVTEVYKKGVLVA